MDDKLSIKSSDSVTTSGEYEIVPEELESQSTHLSTSPTLNIANNGNFNDLEQNLNEVIHELDNTVAADIKTEFTGQPKFEMGKFSWNSCIYFNGNDFRNGDFNWFWSIEILKPNNKLTSEN